MHPTHSFAAMGKDAEWLMAGQLGSDLNFGPDTPMMRVRERNGHVLGLGTRLGKVTFYHCLEDCEPGFPLPAYGPDSPFTVAVVDAEGVRHEKSYFAHNGALEYRIDRPNGAATRDYFTARFEAEGALGWHQVAEARCWLIDAERLYDISRDLLYEGTTIYAAPDDIGALTDGGNPI